MVRSHAGCWWVCGLQANALDFALQWLRSVHRLTPLWDQRLEAEGKTTWEVSILNSAKLLQSGYMLDPCFFHQSLYHT